MSYCNCPSKKVKVSEKASYSFYDYPDYKIVTIHTKECIRNHMAFKDYVQKPITHDMAPITAIPKYTKGDYPKARRQNREKKEFKRILKEDIPFHKDGTIFKSRFIKKLS